METLLVILAILWAFGSVIAFAKTKEIKFALIWPIWFIVMALFGSE